MAIRWLFLLIGAVLTILTLGGCSHRVPIASGTIVFLGDSITSGFGLEPQEAYPALIQIPGMTTLNLGVAGSKTQDGLQRLKDYFNNGGNPRLVVIALGANDILQGVDPAMIQANLTSAIQECKSHNVPVLLCGIRIPWKFGKDSIFQQVADEAHAPLMLDLMQGMQTQESLLQDDHMRPNTGGQKLIAQKIQAALLRSFSFADRK